MGFCCNGFGWGGWSAWGGLGTIGLVLSLVFFVGVLVVLGVGTPWRSPGGGWRRERSPSPNSRTSATGFSVEAGRAV